METICAMDLNNTKVVYQGFEYVVMPVEKEGTCILHPCWTNPNTKDIDLSKTGPIPVIASILGETKEIILQMDAPHVAVAEPEETPVADVEKKTPTATPAAPATKKITVKKVTVN